MFLQLGNFWWQFLLLAIASYLFGSINYSVIFSYLIKKDDIRKYGSGNAGTTNMFRVYGFSMGLFTFTCDCLKGAIACLVARIIFKGFTPDYGIFAGYFAGTFAVLGHILPAMFHMRGGKGFATTVGIGFAMQPIFILCLILPIVAVIFLSDRMSVAALTFATVFLAWHWIFCLNKVGIESCIAVTLIAVMIFVCHKDNIVRLIKGTELPTGIRKVFSKNQQK